MKTRDIHLMNSMNACGMQRCSRWTILLAGALVFLADVNAESSSPVSCPLSGRNSIHFFVQDGKAVKKGEVVVVFNPEPILQVLHAAAGAAREAQNKVSGIEGELATLSVAQDFKRKGLEVDQQDAARAVERYRMIDQPLTEKRLQQAVLDADYGLSTEKERFEGRDDLLKQGVIRKSEWEDAGLKYQRAKLAQETAQANLDAHLKYEKGPQADRLALALSQKEEALKASNTAFENSKTALNAALIAAKTLFASRQAEVVHQQERLKQTALLAPADGVFKAAKEPGSEGKLDLGSEVGEGQLVGTIQSQ